ncbi:MAG TPA: hypothetical protein VNP92_00525, partial [Actinophytocola sp.]|nr:hypothetical protein [Actinophytocola sp.]
MASNRKIARCAAAVAVLAMAVAGCSSQGGAQNQPAPAGGGSGGTPQTGGKTYTIAMVTHEAAGDTFW